MTGRACERTFQLACEDVLDVCNLIIAGKSMGLPKDNRDAIRKLADDKITPKNSQTVYGSLITKPKK